MSEFIDPEEAVKKDTRRAWKFIIAAFVLVFGVFAGVMLFYDCPPPDDSSIMPKFTESPGDYNPLAVFLEELKANPLGDMDKELSLDARVCLRGTEPELKAYLAKQTEPLQAFEKLMQSDPSTWRWPGGEEKGSFHYKSNATSLCLKMGKTLRMKVQVEASERKMDVAALTSLQLAKFGHGLEGAEAQLINYLVAISCCGLGKSSLEQALICGNADTVMLAKLQHEFESLESKRQDFIATLMIEALCMKGSINDIKSGRIAPVGITGEPLGMSVLLLKPNLSQAANVYYLNPVVEGFTLSWKEGWLSSQKMKQECEDYPEDQFRYWVNPNACGKALITEVLPIYGTVWGKALINVATTRLVVLTLAMRRYELEQGRLPVTLDEMVPRYLPAVPTDPFDDAPMRWDPNKKVIYSLGADGKDDGGEKRGFGSFSHDPDICTIYWWSEEAKKGRESKDANDAENREQQRNAHAQSSKIRSKLPKSKSSSKVPTETDQEK